MTTLLLIRHAETVDNVAKIYAGARDSEYVRIYPSETKTNRLTVHGMNQASSLGKSLKTEPITHIFSSDSKRAHRTASAIASHHTGLSVRSHQVLRERDFGDLEGKPWSQFHSQLENGEFRKILETRAMAAWNWIHEEARLLEGKSGSFIVVVSHGVFLSNLLDAVCSFYNASRPRAIWSNTAYAKLRIRVDDVENGLVIESLNDTRHLAN